MTHGFKVGDVVRYRRTQYKGLGEHLDRVTREGRVYEAMEHLLLVDEGTPTHPDRHAVPVGDATFVSCRKGFTLASARGAA